MRYLRSNEEYVSWTAKAGPCPAGDPDLNHYIGELLYKGMDWNYPPSSGASTHMVSFRGRL